jgi:hypothetical protein
MRTGSRSIIANCSSFTANTIVKRAGGYHVISEKDGKNLGGPYKSRGEAEKRLEQVEYFKHTNNADPTHQILHNPSKGHLLALFDTVASARPNYAEEGAWEGKKPVVLRGVQDSKGNHNWGDASVFEHNHLRSGYAHTVTHRNEETSQIAPPLHDNHLELFVHRDGQIVKRGFYPKWGTYPHAVPGIGSELRPAKGVQTQPFLQWGERTDNSIGAIPPGTPPQQGYDQWRNEIGSGQNQYPTGDQASPAEPQPLDEWEGDNAPPTGDSDQMALPSGWEDKRGGKGQQRPGKRPASRYQQPFGDQDVGQGKGDREERNFGPLEF